MIPEAKPAVGETVWEFIDRHCRRFGVMPWIDAEGRLVIVAMRKPPTRRRVRRWRRWSNARARDRRMLVALAISLGDSPLTAHDMRTQYLDPIESWCPGVEREYYTGRLCRGAFHPYGVT